jgi:hypothetical protein
MKLRAKKLISTMAPILTYTMDELLEFAPEILKDGCDDIFDYKKIVLPEIKSDIDEVLLFTAKEKFSEIKDALSKEKVIKSTLELMIYTNCEDIIALDEAPVPVRFVRILAFPKRPHRRYYGCSSGLMHGEGSRGKISGRSGLLPGLG